MQSTEAAKALFSVPCERIFFDLGRVEVEAFRLVKRHSMLSDVETILLRVWTIEVAHIPDVSWGRVQQ
jgi:hypothetical protein